MPQITKPIAGINYRRGFFRLWIALTIILFAVSFFTHLNDFGRVGSLYFGSEKAITDELKYRGTVDRALIRQRPDQTNHPQYSPEQMSKMLTYIREKGTFVGTWTNEMVVSRWTNTVAFEIATKATGLLLLKSLVPSLLLLILGLGFQWIFKGFRQSP